MVFPLFLLEILFHFYFFFFFFFFHEINLAIFSSVGSQKATWEGNASHIPVNFVFILLFCFRIRSFFHIVVILCFKLILPH